ncbi:non-specific serine/threonine protein kinase [Malassezia sp. CBS 17886]|nr:non-specific serine/threonine protein kinase [Malassezia sp. CBS 17886]
MAAACGSVDESALVQLLGDASRATLVKQGAEAKVYRVALYERARDVVLPSASASARPRAAAQPHYVLLKYRFFKRYRHPALSHSVTASRSVSEARSLVRCARSCVRVPRVEFVDETRGILGFEWIDGVSVRRWLGGIPEADEAAHSAVDCPVPQATADNQAAVMDAIGAQLAQMHCADVIHGDLTTSNMMLRPGADPAGEVVLIDFGLASVSSFWEDKAVDLYVLERAFASTHPSSEALFHRVLDSYAAHTNRRTHRRGGKAQSADEGAWPHIYARLQEVRLRGRKRSMVG